MGVGRGGVLSGVTLQRSPWTGATELGVRFPWTRTVLIPAASRPLELSPPEPPSRLPASAPPPRRPRGDPVSPGAGAAPHVARGPLFASVTANRTQTVPQGFLLPPPPIRGHPRTTPARAGRRGESLISLRVFLHASPSGRRESGPASDRAQSPEPLTAAVSPFPQSIPLPLSTSPKGRDPVARKNNNNNNISGSQLFFKRKPSHRALS